VIPVYNGANYLREAIDSALAQTYRDVEVLVVNDGSTDGGRTEEIARSYGERIRYVAQANGGVASALNTGIREMTGAYLSWLSHDDVYLPTKVAAQVARLSSAPDGAVLFGDYEIIDASGRVIGSRRYHGTTAAIRVELVTDDPVHGCATLVPRRSLDVVGPFDVGLRTSQDYDLWFRLAGRFPFVHVPEILLRSRIHAQQGMRTIPTHHEEAGRLLARLVDELSLDDVGRAHPGPPSMAFARIALRLKLRGLEAASCAALSRGRSAVAGEGVAERIRFSAAAAACHLLTRKAKPAYWLARLRAARGAGERGPQ
jgi:glycosyltransferase involved in cell wall biosynthesis